jgi:nucleotide-binding universal stress UspA family protein
MLAVRRILCPIDFSGFSDRALGFAAAVARWQGAEIHGLHVLPILAEAWAFPLAVDAAAGEPLSPAAFRDRLKARLARAQAADLVVECHIRQGGAAHEIVAYARGAAMDLIVMGTHGRSGVERLVLGSVTENVLRHAPCPVLTIPRTEPPTPSAGPPFQRILCAVDFEPSSPPTLSLALTLAQQAAAELILVHVAEPFFDAEIASRMHVPLEAYRRFVETELRTQLAQLVPSEASDWCRPREVVRIGTPWTEIVHAADESRADLIVMGLHAGRGAVDRILFGSTTQQVLRHTACPVLTVTGPVAGTSAVKAPFAADGALQE